MKKRYEIHNYINDNLPIVFHYDVLESIPKFLDLPMHWHENIELLYIKKNSAKIFCDSNTIIAKENDIVVINKNKLHKILPLDKKVEYYCLIINQSLFEGLNEDTFEDLIENDLNVNGILEKIIEEMIYKIPKYELNVKAYITNLMIYLYRNYNRNYLSKFQSDYNKINYVKNAIKYMEENFAKEISIDEISAEIKISKYYLCRIFKEITHYTIIAYLNTIRCKNAQSLLLTGQYSVAEVAERTGFHDNTYFCRVYKRFTGIAPLKSSKTL